MSDVEFIGFQEDGQDKIPLFNITLPSHRKFGSTVTLETLMRLNLKYPKWALDYHEHDYLTNKYDDLIMCVCGEEKLFEPDELGGSIHDL